MIGKGELVTLRGVLTLFFSYEMISVLTDDIFRDSML